MIETLSTTNGEILWEEKNLTEPEKKLESNGELEECGITGSINELKENVLSTDITKTKMSGIYKIINKINQHYYVGSSNCTIRRWGDHKHILNKNKHENLHLQRAWNKYGKNNFDFIFVELVEKSQLLIVEQKYLDIAKTERHKCYNMVFIAEFKNMTGINHPNYKLISENVMNEAKQLWLYKTSTEFISYMKLNGYGSKVVNRVLKNFRQDKNLLLIKDKTYRRNMSNSTSGEKNGRWHKPASQETKFKMSIGRRNKNIYKFKNKMTDELFIGNQYEFYTKYKLTPTHITNIIKGNAISHKNWVLIASTHL